jgi:hypothetical protein
MIMNKNLNLVEILKDCPRGTKLYSTIHGEVEFEKIRVKDDYPIKCEVKETRYGCNITSVSVTIDGKHSINYKGECTLFPSKDQRDWSKFNIEPKFDISNLQPFDKVLARDFNNEKWHCDFYESYSEGIDYYQFKTINNCYTQCVPYNDETKHLVHTTEMPPKKYITWEE